MLPLPVCEFPLSTVVARCLSVTPVVYVAPSTRLRFTSLLFLHPVVCLLLPVVCLLVSVLFVASVICLLLPVVCVVSVVLSCLMLPVVCLLLPLTVCEFSLLLLPLLSVAVLFNGLSVGLAVVSVAPVVCVGLGERRGSPPPGVSWGGGWYP